MLRSCGKQDGCEYQGAHPLTAQSGPSGKAQGCGNAIAAYGIPDGVTVIPRPPHNTQTLSLAMDLIMNLSIVLTRAPTRTQVTMMLQLPDAAFQLAKPRKDRRAVLDEYLKRRPMAGEKALARVRVQQGWVLTKLEEQAYNESLCSCGNI